MNEAVLSIILTICAAGLTHVAVRYVTGMKRLLLIVCGLLSLALAFAYGDALGGFWPGIYTLISVFFLVTVITPWLDYFWRRYRAK
ncbi:MAG: hypothetical protein AAF513_16815 [Pseudomonadota bacterium]